MLSPTYTSVHIPAEDLTGVVQLPGQGWCVQARVASSARHLEPWLLQKPGTPADRKTT